MYAIRSYYGLRVILYRRAMLKISEAIGRKNKAGALITGDSLGQVASQTLENLSVVGEASNLLLLRPLITMDKEEIMQKARQIGTYDISILPHDDCCTRLMPKKPELHARLDQVLEAVITSYSIHYTKLYDKKSVTNLPKT